MLSLSSCKTYSLKTGRIPDEIQSISIQYFQNRAAVINPLLSQFFTNQLQEKFVRESNLTAIKSNGDFSFEGYISEYRNMPNAIQGNETAANNRLTIVINVKFTNNKDTKQSFESAFTRFADYPSTKNFSEVENQLVQEIVSQLVDDIYNKSVSNW